MAHSARPPAGAALVSLRAAVRAAVADLPRDAQVLVALSGGPDSVALAAAAAVELPAGGRRAGAVVVDHGLQAGSAGTAATAARLAQALGLAPVVVVPVQVESSPDAGGPEAAARRARYVALAAAAADHGACAVLTAHTRDDQAESVLLGLGRGSGSRSLSGMGRVAPWPTGGTDVVLLRPLLGLPRQVVRAAAAGLPVADDVHNRDPRYARARVRHDALPALEAAIGPGAAEALARSADLLRDDADALDRWAMDAVGSLSTTYVCVGALHHDGGACGAVVVEVEGEGTAALPVAVRRRVLRRAAVAAGVPAGRLSREHTVALDRLLTDPRVRGPLALPGGVLAERVAEVAVGAPDDAHGAGGRGRESGSPPARTCGRLRLHRRPPPGRRPQPDPPPLEPLAE